MKYLQTCTCVHTHTHVYTTHSYFTIQLAGYFGKDKAKGTEKRPAVARD